MRIVSLLPSATDIVSALGAADDLVGVSHSCTGWDHLPRLTSTRIDTSSKSAEIDAQVKSAAEPLYDLDIELLETLAPDVVVSQSLCDVCAVASSDVEAAVRGLSSQPALVNLEPFCLGDIPEGFLDVGRAIGAHSAAGLLVRRWHRELEKHHHRFAQAPIRIAFLDWIDPPFAAGHWLPDIIEWLGCISSLAQPGQPSHEVTWQQVQASGADVIVAACCGFDADRAAHEYATEDAAETTDIQFLDGHELFSRPSPRLLESVDELVHLLENVR